MLAIVATGLHRHNSTFASTKGGFTTNFAKPSQINNAIFGVGASALAANHPRDHTMNGLEAPCPVAPPLGELATLPPRAARPKPSPLSPIAHFADEVARLYALDDRAPKTCSRVRQIMREIAALTESRRCEDIDPILVATWLDRMRTSTGEVRAPLTKKALSSTLKTICKFGVGRGYLERSPYDAWTPRIKGTKAKKKRHHAYADLVRLLGDLQAGSSEGWKSHRIYAVAATFAMTGLRKMEGLRLKLCDIDLENQTLSVSSRYRLKTEGSERIIGLPDALISILGDWMKTNDSEWLFPNCFRNSFWSEGSAKNKPLAVLKEAGLRSGLEGLTFQSLRHSWTTHAQLRWKLSPAEVAKNLGHTTIKTAFDHYTEDDVDDLKEAVRTISFNRPTEGEGHGKEARDSA